MKKMGSDGCSAPGSFTCNGLFDRLKINGISDVDSGRNSLELDYIFKKRGKHTEKSLADSNAEAILERNQGRDKMLKDFFGESKSNDPSENEDVGDANSVDDRSAVTKKRKREKDQSSDRSVKYRSNCMQDIFQVFLQHQQKLNEEWIQAAEEREQARRLRQQEWMMALKKLEQEIILKEQAWREREEQWRAREEARAERQDKLFSILIGKLCEEQRSQ